MLNWKITEIYTLSILSILINDGEAITILNYHVVKKNLDTYLNRRIM